MTARIDLVAILDRIAPPRGHMTRTRPDNSHDAAKVEQAIEDALFEAGESDDWAADAAAADDWYRRGE